jgi:hypothetical protein
MLRKKQEIFSVNLHPAPHLQKFLEWASRTGSVYNGEKGKGT